MSRGGEREVGDWQAIAPRVFFREIIAEIFQFYFTLLNEEAARTNQSQRGHLLYEQQNDDVP